MASSSRNVIEKALEMLRNVRRVGLENLSPNPGAKKRHKVKGRGESRKAKSKRMKRDLPRIGFEGGQTPFYLRVPKEPYYEGHHERREYPPLSLLQLQRNIDKGFINLEEPIDLNTLVNIKAVKIESHSKHFGVQLTDEGADVFCAKVNIEVQWASELVIAAVERAGGVITTAFYDPLCVFALVDPLEFFKAGVPIPRRMLPPDDCAPYYADPKNRGYLADPALIEEARFELSQKYGYTLPDLPKDPLYNMLMMRKDPRQVYFGLEPGWVVNMKDRVILKPTNEKLKAYYKS